MTDTKVLYGFCDACGKHIPARQLVAVCVQDGPIVEAPGKPTASPEPRWLLLCGSCYVDGEALP